MSGSDEDPSAVNRRPSELNAATDLVGLSTPKAESKEGDDDKTAKPQTIPLDEDIKKLKGGGTGSQPVKVESQAINQNAGGASSAVSSLPNASGSTNTGGLPQAQVLSAQDDPGDDAEKTAFPILLHEIVSDPSTDDCIHWLACGTRFMISDKKKFAKDVLPRFYGHAKFTSFTRRLKRWSFTRVPSGPFMGAYYNPNFRKGEPDLAARVRYDHPTPLSGAAMQLNKAKLQAVGAAAAAMNGGMGGMGGMGAAAFMNPMMGQMQLSDSDREALLRQMNMMNGGNMNNMNMAMMQGSMPQAAAGGNPQLESLYRAMSQNGAAMGQPNNSMALQMAMAQEMMQQRQVAQMGMGMGNMGNFSQLDQARLLAQQQQMQQQQQKMNNPNQMSLLNAAGGFNATGAAAGLAQAQGGAQNEDQRKLMAAMFLDRMNGNSNNQQQQQQQPQQTNTNSQQQTALDQGGGGLGSATGNLSGTGMQSLASVTPSTSQLSNNPGGLSAFNQAQNAMQGTGQSPNNSSQSLLNNINTQGLSSNNSMNTLSGGRAGNTGAGGTTNNPNALFQLNHPNPAATGMGMGANAPGGMAAGAANSNGGMNALLADYLRRTSGAGGAPAPGYNMNGDDKNETTGTEASC
mmetsp:Transcript_12080/g.20937  ORF Transcript_12080/g.20937 Transcript_12080/m.20937 type:complete len:629 (-) Transcript_12080:304-2190(-)